MPIPNIFRRKPPQFFTQEEQKEIVGAIQQSERTTSGEIRLFVESRCKYVNSLDRALEVFVRLKMHETQQRNGVLVYVALKDKQLAVYADQGIYEIAGTQFWQEAVQKMIGHFTSSNYAQGIQQVILQIGETLTKAFPYDAATDINELPDDIVYGK